MPTYEYECKDCGHVFEAFQSMKDAPLKECPRCGKELRRLINGGSGIIFKGSGFYVTDKAGTKTGSSKTPDKTAAGPAPCAAGCAKAESGSCPAAPPPEKKAAG
jgi:putative FmdB family regulatory protein